MLYWWASMEYADRAFDWQKVCHDERVKCLVSYASGYGSNKHEWITHSLALREWGKVE
jgi:hypothetical protein